MKAYQPESKSPVAPAAFNGAGSKALAQFAAVAQFVGGNKTLNITCNVQIGANLCWAAVTEAVTGVSQAQLMQTYTGGKDVVNDPKQALQDNNKYAKEKNTKITWDDMVTEINSNHPIILLIGPKANAHYILLVGFNGTSKSDKARTYTISDPLNGGTEIWTADDFNGKLHRGYYCTS
jgi:PhoPQ-activated pathogenicity-related protein